MRDGRIVYRRVVSVFVASAWRALSGRAGGVCRGGRTCCVYSGRAAAVTGALRPASSGHDLGRADRQRMYSLRCYTCADHTVLVMRYILILLLIVHLLFYCFLGIIWLDITYFVYITYYNKLQPLLRKHFTQTKLFIKVFVYPIQGFSFLRLEFG